MLFRGGAHAEDRNCVWAFAKLQRSATPASPRHCADSWNFSTPGCDAGGRARWRPHATSRNSSGSGDAFVLNDVKSERSGGSVRNGWCDQSCAEVAQDWSAPVSGHVPGERWTMVPPARYASAIHTGSALRNLLQRALRRLRAGGCIAALLEDQLPVRPGTTARETLWPVDPVHHDDALRQPARIQLLDGFHDQVLSARSSATVIACAGRR